jgi:hypothetical protein
MWPFPSVNGVRTPESLALESLPPEKPKTVYEVCQLTEPEEALL